MKLMSPGKRILSLALCAMLFLALLPGAASAENGIYMDPSAYRENAEYYDRSISVASVSTLESALKQAAQQANASNTFYISTTKSITLNKSLTIPGDTVLYVGSGTTLTIASGFTLTNNGMIMLLSANAKLSIKGTLANNWLVICGQDGGKISLDSGVYKESETGFICVQLPQNSSGNYTGNPDNYLIGFNLKDFYRADGGDGWYEYGKKTKPVLNGWKKIGNDWYYFKNHQMVTNAWARDSKGWCYLGEDGRMVTNTWKRDSKGWCFLGSDGRMVVGKWVQYKGESYYMNSKGYMVKGWQKIGGTWYFFESTGAMATNTWKRDSKGWCYLGDNGKMVTDTWQADSKGTCYLGSDGRMVIGKWLKVDGAWYYMNSSGYKTTGWLKLSGKWYYMDDTGVMVTGERTINGKVYIFNSSGVCQNP